MEKKLEPEESLAIIESMISEAKQKIEENGFWFIYWGIIGTIVPLLVYYLGYHSAWHIYAHYPFYLFLIGSIGQFVIIVFSKKEQKKPENLLAKMLNNLWIIISFNVLFIGFILSKIITVFTIPFIVILLGIAIFVSGIVVYKNANVWLGGLLMNVMALLVILFEVSYANQLLFMSFVSLYAFLITGIFLYKNRKK